jgi:hypothetical protein
MNLTSNPLTNENDNDKNDNLNDIKDPEYFGNGEFEFIKNDSREYLVSAHKIVTRLELWSWFRGFTPEPGNGFMFTRGVPELDRLNEEMYNDPVSSGHSGSSYGITLRNMEYIAKNGYEAFKTKYYS